MSVFESLMIHMGDLSDPRILNRSKHQLLDIMVIGVLAVICNAQSWYEMEEFAEAREDWLKSFLDLPNGIPSHDTFSRVYGLIDPKQFEMCFMNWVSEVRKKVADDVICIDGKVSKGTMTCTQGQFRDGLRTVSAWSTLSGVVLGQVKASGGGCSEVSATKELLDLLDIEGLTIVGDAGIGRESVARKIREKKGNYIFPIKRNSPNFFDRIESAFENGKIKKEEYTQEERGHGRIEKRTCTIITRKRFPEGLNVNLDGTESYADLEIIGKMVYQSLEKETRPFINKKSTQKNTLKLERRKDGVKEKLRVKEEVRYFITSLKGSPELLAEKIREQWSIENKLHWVLDVSLGEDGNRTRNKVAAQNLATSRKVAINLVKQDNTKNKSVRVKVKRAGWDINYLEQLIFLKQLN